MFKGFLPETRKFLEQIAKNNNRPWFQAHYKQYQDYILGPGKDMVYALGERLRGLSKDIHAEPRINARSIG